MTIPGVDLSNNNPTVNLAAVAAAGYQFMVHKASEGVGFTDPYFAGRWQEAKDVGLGRLGYHFARPALNTPEAEAAHFLSVVQGQLEPGDGLALDLEAGDGNLLAWALTFLRAVEATVGFKPLLYTGAWFAEPHGLTGSADLGQYGLWLAAYQATMPAPLPGWSFWAIWQNGDKASVPGVQGPCDTNVFNGTLDQLRAYGMPAKPAPPIDPRDAEIVALKANVATLETQLDAAYARLTAGLNLLPGLQAALQGGAS